MIPEYKIEEIRLRLDREATSSIVEHLGYKVFRGHKYSLRKEDRTPSVSIRADGYMVDFGGDFRGDAITLLQQYHQMSFPQALEYIAECLGVEL